MVKVGLAVGTCGNCGKEIARNRPADYAVCDCSEYCPSDHGKGRYGTPMVPYTGTVEDLFVDAIVNELCQWVQYGVSPYLNKVDDNSYISRGFNGYIEKYFKFKQSDTGGILAPEKVEIQVCGRQIGNGARIYIWDGSWNNVGDLMWSKDVWDWYSIDVTSVLKDFDKIKNARVYFEKIGQDGFASDITAARLRITWSSLLDLTPSTYGPLGGGGKPWGDLEHPMQILYVCPVCQYHSARGPVDVKLS